MDNQKISKVIIPGSVKTISSHAFAFSSVEEVIIEDGLQYIGDQVFNECLNLRNITIPESVTEIGSHIFLPEEGVNDYTITVHCKENSVAHQYAIKAKQNVRIIK